MRQSRVLGHPSEQAAEERTADGMKPGCPECGRALTPSGECPNEACSMSLLDPPVSRVRRVADANSNELAATTLKHRR